MMRCPNCNTKNREDARFCVKCGASLGPMCPECGRELPPEAMFCDACGARVGGPSAEVGEKRAAPDAVAERLRRLVPREYAERLLAASGQMAGERRLVTILFSDVKGSTAMADQLDPEEVLEIMDGAFDVLIQPVMRYEGTLARLMGDAVLAFFGAPIAHEDDPERACRAAVEIVEGARAYGERLDRERGIDCFNVRVGINTGLVVVGEVGSDLRVEYTAMGDAVNLAARMEQNAPAGGILITHDTYRHVRGVFDVLVQDPLQVKGKREPVKTYVVQRAKPRAFRKGARGVEGIETRMIGREAELTRLQEAFLTAVEDRELQMVTVVGEAGVGKSRLLHEFDNWAELLPQTFYYFKGRARQEMQNVPYALLRSLFSFRFQIEDSDPVTVVREKLEQGVGAASGEEKEKQAAAHLIGHLVGFELGESPHLKGVLDDPKEVRDRALAYLAAYLGALASENPVLVLLEDLHWADNGSLDALNQLTLALVKEPVMVACAARPDLFERRPHWGEGQPFHRRLPLEPLTKRNTRRLLDEILQKVEDKPDTLNELVVGGAEGNPFFVEELIKMLVEDGVILKGEDHWRVEPTRLSEVRVPPTLRGVLQARLDRLPVEDRTVLQQASVVGRQFWDRAVMRINEATAERVGENEVLDTLTDLRAREMVFQRETTAFAGTDEYVFKHNVLREVTYESLLKRVRRVYHGLVADWLMEQRGDRASEYTGMIADHLELAARSGEAIEYLLEAGDRARALYAQREAIGAYQRALSLLKEVGDQERAARTLMKLGLAYHTAFEFPASQSAYEEGFHLWQRAAASRPSIPPAVPPHAFRIPWNQDIPTLDPALAYDDVSGGVIEHLFAGLAQLTPELDVVPSMARSWAILEGGREYEFFLRDDICWSDGRRVTAYDFENAWKRLLSPATGSAYAAILCDVNGAQAFMRGEVSDPDSLGVHASGPLTLTVELEVPVCYFLYLLTHWTTYPVPQHVVETLGDGWMEPRKIVSNGPFRLEDWRASESLVLERNPGYPDQFRGNVQRVELRLSGDQSDSLAEYEMDMLDVLDLTKLAPSERYQAMQRHPGEYVVLPDLASSTILFNLRMPPCDDRQVRRALAMCADQETLGNVIWEGSRAPAKGGYLPPGMPGHSPRLALPYDPERGRQLLARAGYPAGRGFPRIRTLAPTAYRGTADHLRAQWRQDLGVDISFELLDWSGYAAETLEGKHLVLFDWRADYPDPDNFVRGEAVTRSGFLNEAYAALVEKARRTTDQEERMALYREADRILVEEAAVVPLTYRRQQWLVKPWVGGFPGPWKDVIIRPH